MDEEEEALKDEMRSAFINRHFVGSAFEDRLFYQENNTRETAACWKILRKPNFKSLTDNSWYWKAVGLPIDLLSDGPQGDLDLVFAVRGHSRRPDGGHSFRRVYRCFEVKTAKVTAEGKVTSLKVNKFGKVRAQLSKLWALGVPQLVLLEVFIIQAGYSQLGDTTAYPAAMRDVVAERYLSMTNAPWGYMISALEQMLGYSENDTGLIWPHQVFKGGKEQPIGKPFATIVTAVEQHIQHSGGSGYHTTVTYCYDCRKLITVDDRGPYECTCGRPFF